MEYLIGNKQTFLDFLNGITKEDKIAILSHNDLDGIASAVFLEKILEKKGFRVELIEFMKIQPNMLKGKADKLNEYGITKVFIADVSCESIDNKNFQILTKDIDTLLIDHHPISPDLENKDHIIKTESHNCAAQLIFELGNEFIDTNEWTWLLCATMFAEFSYTKKENLELIQKFYPDVTEENIATSIPGMNARKIGNALIYFDKDLEHVHRIVLKKDMEELDHAFGIIEEEINKATEDFSRNKEVFEDQKIYWYEFSPKFNIASVIATITSKMMPEYSFLTITKGETYTKVSSRNQSGNRDMSLLMKKGTSGLENAGGGGHAKASAARFQTKDLEKFKENILGNSTQTQLTK
ncbi:DHH family phosphoesterase [Candidatus Pacearchaeota archaeon]|nr:DHH family phosphoesterase [Candidatus Pacearchaeota archaeon]